MWGAWLALVLVVMLGYSSGLKQQVPIRRKVPLSQHASHYHRHERRRLARAALSSSGKELDGFARRRTTLSRFHKRPRKSSGRGRSLQVASEAFISCDDVIYYGSIKLGNSNLQVILDTGSADLWVFSKTCTNCPSTIDTYDHSQSGYYVAKGDAFSIQYADGDQVSGYLSQDWLTWAGLSVEEQIFAEISDAASFSLVCAEDGLMGMAFSNIADSNAATPFENLVDSGELDAPIFSFYLADDDSGVLTLGGVDESHHTGDDVTWLSLATPFYGFWEVDFHHVRIGSDMIGVGEGWTALLDTGTTLIYGPPEVVAQLSSSLQARCYYLEYASQTLYEDYCSDTSSSLSRSRQLSYDYGYYYYYIYNYFDGESPLYIALVPCGDDSSDDVEVTFSFGATLHSGAQFTFGRDDLVLPPSTCPSGFVMDCAGSCLSQSDVNDWLGDGYCDDGTWGIWLNCPAFNCDHNDCSDSACDFNDPGSTCMLGMDAGEAGDTYWVMGDVFLRKIFTAYNLETGNVGMAYSSVVSDSGTRPPTLLPSLSDIGTTPPTRLPIYQPTAQLLIQPSGKPSAQPTAQPIAQPTAQPTYDDQPPMPGALPTSRPSLPRHPVDPLTPPSYAPTRMPTYPSISPHLPLPPSPQPTNSIVTMVSAHARLLLTSMVADPTSTDWNDILSVIEEAFSTDAIANYALYALYHAESAQQSLSAQSNKIAALRSVESARGQRRRQLHSSNFEWEAVFDVVRQTSEVSSPGVQSSIAFELVQNVTDTLASDSFQNSLVTQTSSITAATVTEVSSTSIIPPVPANNESIIDDEETVAENTITVMAAISVVISVLVVIAVIVAIAIIVKNRQAPPQKKGNAGCCPSFLSSSSKGLYFDPVGMDISAATGELSATGADDGRDDVEESGLAMKAMSIRNVINGRAYQATTTLESSTNPIICESEQEDEDENYGHESNEIAGSSQELQTRSASKQRVQEVLNKAGASEFAEDIFRNGVRTLRDLQDGIVLSEDDLVENLGKMSRKNLYKSNRFFEDATKETSEGIGRDQ